MALNDADNWFNTHRFGGKCMVIGGIVLIITSPLKNIWIIIAAAIIPCILPAVYSYMYYRKKNYDVMSVREPESCLQISGERRMTITIAAIAAASSKATNRDIMTQKKVTYDIMRIIYE